MIQLSAEFSSLNLYLPCAEDSEARCCAPNAVSQCWMHRKDCFPLFLLLAALLLTEYLSMQLDAFQAMTHFQSYSTWCLLESLHNFHQGCFLYRWHLSCAVAQTYSVPHAGLGNCLSPAWSPCQSISPAHWGPSGKYCCSLVYQFFAPSCYHLWTCWECAASNCSDH